MDSRSVRPLLEGRHEPHRDFVVSGLLDWDLVWDGHYELVRRQRGYRLVDEDDDGVVHDAGDLDERIAKQRRAMDRPQDWVGDTLLFDLDVDPNEDASIVEQAAPEVERLSALRDSAIGSVSHSYTDEQLARARRR